jgi:transcriptional regulator with XRE-family HTH domain
MTGESPAVARRRLRLVLRKAREAKGLTQGQVAEALEWSLSKVNRIESGEVTISNTDLKALLGTLGITDGSQIDELLEQARLSRRRGWWDDAKFREHLTNAMMQLLQFESQASAIRVFQPTLIPGILQTRAYSEFVMSIYSGELSEADRAIRLEVRMRRGSQVFDRPDPPDYRLLLDESVLLREMVGPRVMAEQLRHVLELVRRSRVSVRISPLADAAILSMFGPFTMFDLGDEENAVLYRESPLGDEILHSSDTVRRHREVFEDGWERAMGAEASVRLIEARAAIMLSLSDRPSRYG